MFEKLSEFDFSGNIVVLPDFFLDRIIKINSKDELFRAITNKTTIGGGSIRGVNTFDIKGGNAVNVAYCLATMGFSVTLFTVADNIGASILRTVFSKFGESVNLQIRSGRQGSTTSFEFHENEGTNANVMISDVGDNQNFGPEMISTQTDIETISSAKSIVLTNWASNFKGTDLANYLFTNSPNAFHFLDPADIETRKEEFRDTLKNLSNSIDVLSINENECTSLIKACNLDSKLSLDFEDIDNVRQAANLLSSEFELQIDLHTRIGGAWSDGEGIQFVKSFDVVPKKLTGSGDCWDAADILGHLSHLDANERLLFSNAYASLYVSRSGFEPPTIDEAVDFAQKNIQ
jgi:ribokinase